MIQLALIAVSIGLIVLGIKGFTKSGLQFSKGMTLTGSSGKIVGVICIVAGVGLIPAAFLLFALFAGH